MLDLVFGELKSTMPLLRLQESVDELISVNIGLANS